MYRTPPTYGKGCPLYLESESGLPVSALNRSKFVKVQENAGLFVNSVVAAAPPAAAPASHLVSAAAALLRGKLQEARAAGVAHWHELAEACSAAAPSVLGWRLPLFYLYLRKCYLKGQGFYLRGSTPPRYRGRYPGGTAKVPRRGTFERSYPEGTAKVARATRYRRYRSLPRYRNRRYRAPRR